MAQPPDLEHKRKRDSEEYGQTASSQPIVPQQQQQGQGAFFLLMHDCAPPLSALCTRDPCATTQILADTMGPSRSSTRPFDHGASPDLHGV